MKTDVLCCVLVGRHTESCREPMLGLRWSAGITLSVLQMRQDFSNDFLLCDERDHAEDAATVTFQGID